MTTVFTVKEHAPLKTGEDLPDAMVRWADPGYFSALGIPLVSGRFFTSDERGCTIVQGDCEPSTRTAILHR